MKFFYLTLDFEFGLFVGESIKREKKETTNDIGNPK
jgi:hypothetical protein